MSNNIVLACDIGGTHITSALVNTSTFELLTNSVVRNPLDSSLNAKSIFQVWTQTMNRSLASFNGTINSLGIAMPGPFDYKNGISLIKGQNKYDNLYKLNIIPNIVERLTIEEPTIRLINDAAAFLQGEVFANQLQNENKILGITLGTGLGSSAWQRGEIAIDCELWNTPYLDSIFEDYLVTRFVVNKFEDLTGIKEKGFKEIIEKHAQTDAFKELINEYSTHLFNFLDFFGEKYHCQKFIIGGSIAKAWSIISSPKKDQFKRFDIFIGKYDEKAAILGAASLFAS